MSRIPWIRSSASDLFAIVLIFSSPALSQELSWLRSYSEGMQIAKETKRPVLVDFWSESCLPCVKADKEVYTNPAFVAEAERFVLIRVDADKDRVTAARFGITALPTRLILDPREMLLRKVTGPVGASDLVELMGSVPASPGPPPVTPDANTRGVFIGPKPPPVKPPEVIPGEMPATVLIPEGVDSIRSTSIIDLPDAELLQKYPADLKDVNFDVNQDQLGVLLGGIGQRVDEFLANLPNTVSKEWIRRERLGVDGKAVERTAQSVHYLLILHLGDDGMDWEEARTDDNGKPVRLSTFTGASFLTSGFAMECIILSTRQQALSRFRYLGTQSSKPHAHLIAFAQKPGMAVPGRFRMNELTADFLSQGIAWIDPANLQVIQIRTDLLEPLPNMGLTKLTTEISYSDQRFNSSPRTFWLPREVVVTFRYGGRDYRNTHRYSEYKLFSVESYEKTEPARRNPTSGPQ